MSIAQYLEDINNVYTDWKDGGRLDLIADAIVLDTGTTIPDTITTLQTSATAIEGYTDDIGVAGVGLTAITGLAIAEEDIATLSEVGDKVVLDMDANSVLAAAILEAVTTLLLRLR